MWEKPRRRRARSRPCPAYYANSVSYNWSAMILSLHHFYGFDHCVATPASTPPRGCSLFPALHLKITLIPRPVYPIPLSTLYRPDSIRARKPKVRESLLFSRLGSEKRRDEDDERWVKRFGCTVSGIDWCVCSYMNVLTSSHYFWLTASFFERYSETIT